MDRLLRFLRCGDEVRFRAGCMTRIRTSIYCPLLRFAVTKKSLRRAGLTKFNYRPVAVKRNARLSEDETHRDGGSRGYRRAPSSGAGTTQGQRARAIGVDRIGSSELEKTERGRGAGRSDNISAAVELDASE